MNSPSYLVGNAPEWLKLGTPVDVGGVMARPVLGDWSHLPERDRPPAFIADYALAPVYSKDPDRPPVPQVCPGKSIKELEGKHSGKCAVLMNGPTLGTLGLWRVRRAGIPMIGTNRAHMGFKDYYGPQPEYLCVADSHWMDVEDVQKHPGLINGCVDKRTVGYRATRSGRMTPFSFDLWRDGYVAPIPCTTGHLALQVAVYLGFTEIFCLGFDLSGGHLDGSGGSRHYNFANAFHKAQAPLLKERGIKVWVCASPLSKVTAFEKCDWEDLFK